MQSNNLIQVFSQAKNNYYNDTEIVTSGVQTIVSMGAVSGQYSNSALYNSFCLSMSLPVVALVDYIAQQNPSVTFGMALGIDQWISAVQGTFANYTDTQNSINAINTNIANITNGTTTVGNASNVTTNINGKAISTIFESDGTTVKNATNAVSANVATSLGNNLSPNNYTMAYQSSSKSFSVDISDINQNIGSELGFGLFNASITQTTSSKNSIFNFGTIIIPRIEYSVSYSTFSTISIPNELNTEYIVYRLNIQKFSNESSLTANLEQILPFSEIKFTGTENFSLNLVKIV